MQIRKEFHPHAHGAPGPIANSETLAIAFTELLEKIEVVMPASRERALVVTKLQEAHFWAQHGLPFE